jgi:hypothetical protein
MMEWLHANGIKLTIITNVNKHIKTSKRQMSKHHKTNNNNERKKSKTRSIDTENDIIVRTEFTTSATH